VGGVGGGWLAGGRLAFAYEMNWENN